MRPNRCMAVVLPFLAAFLLASCGGTVVADSYVIEHEPSHLETVEGSHARVVLTAPAAQRLGLRTASVELVGDTLTVPSAAVFVDPEGVWWVYTNPEPLVYVRHEIGLVQDDGGRALLSSGPPVGTNVVTVGVAELYGVEDAVGH